MWIILICSLSSVCVLGYIIGHAFGVEEGTNKGFADGWDGSICMQSLNEEDFNE